MTDIEVKINKKIDEYIGGILAKDQITHDDYRALQEHLNYLRMERMSSALTTGYNLARDPEGGDAA